ncbi:GMP reductase [bacterium]|nr:GMP reductase [bacterium]
MLISQDVKLDYDDVLIVPQRTTLESRSEVVLERNFSFYHSPRSWRGVPIVCSNMVPLTSMRMAEALSRHKMITALHKYYDPSDLAEIISTAGVDYAWVSIGKSELDVEKILRVSDLMGSSPNIVIDVPNGYMESFVKFCSMVRGKFPESIICGGNVTTPEICEELVIHGGIDICKIQISPGSQCETRKMTGIGYGTFSCVQECSHATHGLRSNSGRLGLVMSDGGCRTPGDVCKALCGGSDFVMLGGMFAGTDECDGEWDYEYKNSLGYWEKLKPNQSPVDPIRLKKTHLTFYGMSSHYAQEKHGSGKKKYRASEGKVSKVPFKGSVEDIIQEVLGGVRSCGAYIGAKNLKDYSKCAKFIRIARQQHI